VDWKQREIAGKEQCIVHDKVGLLFNAFEQSYVRELVSWLTLATFSCTALCRGVATW